MTGDPGPTTDDSRAHAVVRALTPRRTCTDAEVADMLRRAADTVFRGDEQHAQRLRQRADALEDGDG